VAGLRPKFRENLMRIAFFAAIAATAALASAPASSQPKQEETSPLLVPVGKAHCIALYDVVELRLKGQPADMVSAATRNGLKDFFVTRPGVVDCTGQREIAWTDDKDRAFIDSILKAANEASKSKLDLARDYGIAAASRPTQPRR
jgi:hypothetical protein